MTDQFARTLVIKTFGNYGKQWPYRNHTKHRDHVAHVLSLFSWQP